MKRYLGNITALLVGLCMLVACTEESWVDKNEVEEGVPVTLRIPFSAPDMTRVTTKAAGDNAKLINDFYIFIFNTEGGFVYGKNVYPDGTNDSSGSIQIETTSGSRRIYAVANTKSSMYPNVNSLVEDAIKNEQGEAEFLAMVARLSTHNVELNDGIMLMSGQWADKNGNKDCLIPASSTATLDGTISIRRVAAKVTFSIKNGTNAKGSFTPVEYKVMSVPDRANIFDGTDAGVAGVEYFDLESFTPIRGNGFTFYMSENLQTATTCQNVDDREWQENGTFVKAPEHSTYVIVKGSYSGKASDNGVDADVTAPRVLYYIHLGKGAGNTTDSHYNANDFSTERNTDYTYNLTVNGVDNIVVEVLTNDPNGDNKPREEGDVIFGGAENVFRCDAHYEQRLLTFTKSKLKDFSFAVRTPYTVGVYDADEDVPADADINWVKFYKTSSNRSCVTYTNAVKDMNNLWDVKKLVAELKSWEKGEKHSDWGSTVYFTCFIDEYYYADKPKEWGTYVNTGEDRTIQILCSSTTQQEGLGNSTVVKNAQYVISQRPIQTIYNKDLNGQIVAWGIETVNETGRLELGDGLGNSETNGRENFPKIGRYNWETYVNFTEVPDNAGKINYMKMRYEKASYACLQRNRDENGNGKIDTDEIKWYLPASGQMVSMWIGNEALSEEANIYGSEGGKGEVPADRHLYTSTSGKGIYWAEEGYSLGDDRGYVQNDDGKRQYRCVRNLGNDSSSPSPIYKTSKREITTNLSPLALRQAPATIELRSHHEREDVNRVYKDGFSYESEDWNVDSWNLLNQDANTNPTSSYCQKKYGDGWRLPNQRELGLMYLNGLRSSGQILCRTYYSGYPMDASQNPGKTHTFRISGGLLTLHEQGGGGVYRCVKDNY